MKGVRAVIDRARRKAGKLPRSYVIKGAAADLFPDDAACSQLFFDIAERKGIKEAQRIIKERAPKAPAGRKERDGGRTTKKDKELLARYVDEKSKNPKLNGTSFARIELKGKANPSDSEIRRITESLRRARRRTGA